MYSTETRVRLVKKREREIRLLYDRMSLRVLSGICAALLVCICVSLSLIHGSVKGTVFGINGTMLMFESAGGYVLVGVLSFVAAVIFTLVCLRLRKKPEDRRSTLKDTLVDNVMSRLDDNDLVLAAGGIQEGAEDKREERKCLRK